MVVWFGGLLVNSLKLDVYLLGEEGCSRRWVFVMSFGIEDIV